MEDNGRSIQVATLKQTSMTKLYTKHKSREEITILYSWRFLLGRIFFTNEVFYHLLALVKCLSQKFPAK